MSVYAAITAQHIKIPAEQSLLGHLQFVSELLDKGVVNELGCSDTRDMIADGLTKGVIERNALQSCMEGSFVI